MARIAGVNIPNHQHAEIAMLVGVYIAIAGTGVIARIAPISAPAQG